MTHASPGGDTFRAAATIAPELPGIDTPKGANTMINISVSSRSLAAARRVDPDVSPAAVHAAVEAAISELMREQRRRLIDSRERDDLREA